MGFLKTKEGQRNNNVGGFMMVEILVATAILVIFVLVATAVAEKSIRVARRALYSTQSSFLLEEGAEAVRILRDNSWDINIATLSSGVDYYPLFSGGTWTLSASPQTVGVFARKVALTDTFRHPTTGVIAESGNPDPGTKLITVSVSWLDGGVTVSKSLPFYIMDIF
jgi:type II secretory pathway pseudopilin PulG